MLSSVEILILSAIQGLSEFLPVSSAAHLVLVSKYYDFLNQNLLKFQESTALEMRDILTDKNTFSILSKELPISIIDKRQKQLKLLTSIKNDVSRLLSGGAGDGEMNEIQNLSELVKDDDMGIPEDEDISEAIYDIIKRRNHQFNLPRYSIISDLELVNFMVVFLKSILGSYSGKYSLMILFSSVCISR